MPTTDTLTDILIAEEKLSRQTTKASIVFIDLVGSTRYKVNRGIEAGLKRIVRHNLLISEVVKEVAREAKDKQISKCRICKYIGDEAMIYVCGRKAALVAAQMALRVRERFGQINFKVGASERFESRYGIDYGPVLFYEYFPNNPDPQGLVVDRAARLVKLAKENQVLVSEDVRNVCRHSGLKFCKKTERRLEGIKKRVGICELLSNSMQERGVPYMERTERAFYDKLKKHLDDISDTISDLFQNPICTSLRKLEDTASLLQNLSKVDVIFDIQILMERYTLLKKDAEEVDGIWNSDYGDVKDYFKQEHDMLREATPVHIRRLVNINKVPPEAFKTHLHYMKQHRGKGYEYRFSDITEFELLFGKYRERQNIKYKALFTILDLEKNLPAIGLFLDPDREPKLDPIVKSLHRWFGREWDRAGKIDATN